eukprot:133712-Alexandrium_andersonii.AAC.1
MAPWPSWASAGGSAQTPLQGRRNSGVCSALFSTLECPGLPLTEVGASRRRPRRSVNHRDLALT